VVLEQGEPAGEASGRNGGNFELFPENSVGMYEGLASERLSFLRRRYPGLPTAIIQAESERQASIVLGLALRNRDLLRHIILREQIDCDFAPKGWLHLACGEEQEQAMCDEVMLAAQHGQRIEIWSRRRIREEFGIAAAFLGRFSPGDGTYHPFRYACGLLVRGQVDATIKVRQQRHLLAQLSAGSIFGQVSLLAGRPRSATCTIRRDALLAQLDRAACERLLGTRAPVALKLLAVLNRGLTDALRIADRRLMQLEDGGMTEGFRTALAP